MLMGVVIFTHFHLISLGTCLKDGALDMFATVKLIYIKFAFTCALNIIICSSTRATMTLSRLDQPQPLTALKCK